MFVPSTQRVDRGKSHPVLQAVYECCHRSTSYRVKSRTPLANHFLTTHFFDWFYDIAVSTGFALQVMHPYSVRNYHPLLMLLQKRDYGYRRSQVIQKRLQDR